MMRHRTLLTALAGAALLPALATPAFGSEGDEGGDRFYAHLAPVPHDSSADSGSNVTGEAHLVSVDGKLMVDLTASGLSPDLAHLAHIHGQVEAESECPGPDRAPGGVDDLLIETVDGLPDYGPILVTFSTSGDTSPESGLALDRAPVADEDGHLSYHRLLEVPEELQDDLDDLHIVIHGEDLDDDGAYDPGPITELGAPLEAELPVACGELDEGDHHHDDGHDHDD
jgi:hypothetical protein